MKLELTQFLISGQSCIADNNTASLLMVLIPSQLHGCFIYVIICVIFISSCLSYHTNDIVSSHYQTVHAQWKTPWVELPINQMPKFGQNDAHVVRFTLPSNKTAHRVKIDPNYDVKLTLAFADHKLISPLIVTFDSVKKKLLKKCIVTFMHDEYDILRIKYDYEYGVQIRQLDTSHPSLSAVELIYVWDSSVQVDDTALGIVMLFILTLVFLMMLCFVTYNGIENQSRSTGSGSVQHYSIGQARRSSQGQGLAGGAGVRPVGGGAGKSVRFDSWE